MFVIADSMAGCLILYTCGNKSEMIFFLIIFVLFSSINIYTFLNQDAFTWQVKWLYYVLFSENTILILLVFA